MAERTDTERLEWLLVNCDIRMGMVRPYSIEYMYLHDRESIDAVMEADNGK